MDFKNDKGQVSIIMVGATGAVGGATLTELFNMELCNDIIILGRRLVENVGASFVKQYSVDLFNPTTYKSYIDKQEVAICTLGVGQPSKVSKDEFIKIDKSAVLDFARTCKNAGKKHFQLLS
jgi:hypothetical protein